MRFLVDESTGAAVARALRVEGHDVLEIDSPGLDDESVLDLAASQQRVLITNDKDFGDLIYRRGRAHSGVLLLRLADESSAAKVQATQAAVEQLGDRILGRFAVVTETHIRLRPQ